MKKKILCFLISMFPILTGCNTNENIGKVKVTCSGENVSFATEETYVNKDSEVSINVKANEGYVLTENCFTVNIGGFSFTKNPYATMETNVFTYENETLTISKTFVVDNIQITATPKEIGNEGFYLTTKGENVTFNPMQDVVNSNGDYKELVIKPNDGYELDKENMTVTIGSNVYGINDGAFTITTNGEVTIFQKYITGNIVVSCDAKTDLIKVTTYPIFCSITPGDNYITGQNEYSVTLSKNKLLAHCDIEKKKIFLRKSTTFYSCLDSSCMTYDGNGEKGTLTINKEFINTYVDDSKDFCIYCVLLNDDEFNINNLKLFDLDLDKINLNDITIESTPEVANNQTDLVIKLKPNDETKEIDASSIRVTINGTEYEVGEKGITYNEETGELTVPAGSITGDVSVTADVKDREDLIYVNYSKFSKGATFADSAKTYAFVNTDYTATVTANEGYQDITINDFVIEAVDKSGKSTTLINTNEKTYYEFDKNVLKIIGANAFTEDLAGGTVYIKCNPHEEPITYNVTYVYEKSDVELLIAPDTITSENDLIVNLNNLDNTNGLVISVTSGGETIEYNLNNNDDINKNKTITVDKKNYKGDIVVTITAVSNKITFPDYEGNKINLLNYETSKSFSYSNPTGDLEVIDHTNGIISSTIDTTNNTIRFTSTSDSITDDTNNYVELSNGNPYTNVKVYFNVTHPTSLKDTLNCFTLATIQGKTSFDLTFKYTNSEDYNTFINHLEIIENMRYYNNTGLEKVTYNTGKDQTNSFKLTGLNAHGRSYGTSEDEATEFASQIYSNIQNVNYSNRPNDSSAESTLAIDDKTKTYKELTVYNSEELFWVVEHGYRPLFDSNNDASLKTKTLYETAKKIVEENTNDKMSTYEELRALYDYLISNTHVNYGLYPIPSDFAASDKIKYKSYFLEGVFSNNGICTSDALAKAYALLCRIDGLEVIRSFGYGTSTNYGSYYHSWNYAYIEEDSTSGESGWYLIDAKSGKNKIEYDYDSKSYCEVPNYDLFLVKKELVVGTEEGKCTDLAFTELNNTEYKKNSNYYANNLEHDSFHYGEDDYDYIISSRDELVFLLRFLINNYNETGKVYNVCIGFNDISGTPIAAETITNWFAYIYENKFKFNKDSLYQNDTYSYCNMIYKGGQPSSL